MKRVWVKHPVLFRSSVSVALSSEDADQGLCGTDPALYDAAAGSGEKWLGRDCMTVGRTPGTHTLQAIFTPHTRSTLRLKGDFRPHIHA